MTEQEPSLSGEHAFLDIARYEQFQDEIRGLQIFFVMLAADHVGMLNAPPYLPFVPQGSAKMLVPGLAFRKHFDCYVFGSHLVKDFPDPRILTLMDPADEMEL